jgi:H+/Cl- antiporter ClcA
MRTGSGVAGRAHLLVLVALQSLMTVELILLTMSGEWMHVFLVIAVMAGILAPELVRRKLSVQIPSEIQIVATLFVFATLFLGEVRDYYERIWWWDLALHTTAGLLLGLLGFLIVYALNESREVQVRMRPSFVALFAFVFAMAIGTIWEIFEFAMDQLFNLTMQKPTARDPSGLTDTMWDMIVNALGAAVVSFAGWRYMRQARRRHVDTWVARFVRRNRRWRRRTV